MPVYEIDFHRVGEGCKSGDAISLRYLHDGVWRVVVVDGGYEQTGHDLCDHIQRYYGTRQVDFVISTHPDNDHMSGLRVVLQRMRVQQLWMHVPWAHTQQILPLFRSRRWLAPNLENELTRQYPYIAELLQLATQQGTRVYLPFAGAEIGPFVVLSPSRAMYEGLLPQFRATPQSDRDMLVALGHWLEGIGQRPVGDETRSVREEWWSETLREGGITSAENESSVILLGQLPGKTLLLTGDAGLVALREAAHYAVSIGRTIQRPSIFQVPHHGSRNNISPSWLDYVVGPVVAPGTSSTVTCVVSAGAEDEHHPRQVVVNALQRRGAAPWSTKGGMLYFSGAGVPGRGWGSAVALQFHPMVERYD